MAFTLSAKQGGASKLVLSWVLLHPDNSNPTAVDKAQSLRQQPGQVRESWTASYVYPHMGIGQEPGLEDIDFDPTVERANHRCWALEFIWSLFINVANK